MTELFTCPNCGNHGLIVTHEYTLDYGQYHEYWREWGPLDNDHHWEYDDSEKTDDEFLTWDEDVSDEPETIDHEFFVNCEGCDREVEFGWSHPDRAGRIWPAECTDFNPWLCWPEPRYKDSWQTKNWLRFVKPDGTPR